jgi:HPt (histidine-containing phosphotransfer) domain-containing protein
MGYTNLNYLQNITGDDTNTIIELINLFIEQVPEFTGNLKKHLEEKRYIELGKEAHKAKSSVMIMGMDDLGHDLKAFQIKTINGTDVETYSQHVDRFERECLSAVEELQQELLRLGQIRNWSNQNQ